MSNFRVKKDLKTILTDVTIGIQHSNITGISAIPSIRIKGDETPTAIVSGEIVINDAVRGVSVKAGDFRKARYVVDGHTYFEDNSNDPPSDQTLNEMMAEYERVLDLNTQNISAEYDFEFIESREKPPYTKGKHDWRIEATTRQTLADGT